MDLISGQCCQTLTACVIVLSLINVYIFVRQKRFEKEYLALKAALVTLDTQISTLLANTPEHNDLAEGTNLVLGEVITDIREGLRKIADRLQ